MSAGAKRFRQLAFVTGNANKLKEVNAIIGGVVPNLTSLKIGQEALVLFISEHG